jgi:pyridoxine 5-phosphate synthase
VTPLSQANTKLSVNLNKVALLRNTRALGIPSVRRAAEIVLKAGAAGITVHPRPDGRHVRAHDVSELAELLQMWPNAEYNIEGNPFHQLLDFVRDVKPHQCTLVPDDTGQFTSDHGWDLPKDSDRLRPVIAELKSLGVRVSLFMDPVPAMMQQVKLLGADRIELYTEPYAQAFGTPRQADVIRQYAESAAAAHALGLGVNAGHDLNSENLPAFLGGVRPILEVSIGHALIADALELGYKETVQRYLAAIAEGNQ